MLILLSPAKKQDFNHRYPQFDATKPLASKQTALLIDNLKPLSKGKIADLMSVSDKIATLNYERYQDFNPQKYTRTNALQAIFALRGDAYQALDADSLDLNGIDYLQQHLVILSGLYGYLRPLDLIQPYRLEMKTRLANTRGKDLYQFWDDRITKALTKMLGKHKHKTIINLASNEYFKALTPGLDILNVTFKEKKGAQYKVIGINAKRARGLMTRYMADKNIQKPEQLKKFNQADYHFNEKLSSDNELVFTR